MDSLRVLRNTQVIILGVCIAIATITSSVILSKAFLKFQKSTHAVIKGVEHNIFKDPVTDSGVKKSATGRVSVRRNGFGTVSLVDGQTWAEQEAGSFYDQLCPVFIDGKVYNESTLQDIRDRVRG